MASRNYLLEADRKLDMASQARRDGDHGRASDLENEAALLYELAAQDD
jgi:hypothetical protein